MGGSAPSMYQSDMGNTQQQMPQSSGFTGTNVNPSQFPNTGFHEPVQPVNTNFTGIGAGSQTGQQPQLQLLGLPGGPIMGQPQNQDFPNMNYTGAGSSSFPMWNNQQAQQTQQGALTGLPLFQGFNNVSSASTFNGPQNPTTPFANAVTNVLGWQPGR